jgi:hypothetical protein
MSEWADNSEINCRGECLSRLKYRLPRCHSGELLGPRLLPPYPFNHLRYCLNHDIRSVILDLVPTSLGDDPHSTNCKMAKLLLHLLPCCVRCSINISGKTRGYRKLRFSYSTKTKE